MLHELIIRIPGLIWLALALACVFEHRLALREYLGDYRYIPEGVRRGLFSEAEARRLTLATRNIALRYQIRLAVAVNNAVIGIIGLFTVHVSTGTFIAAFGVYVLVSLLGNELAMLILTLRDRITRRQTMEVQAPEAKA